MQRDTIELRSGPEVVVLMRFGALSGPLAPLRDPGRALSVLSRVLSSAEGIQRLRSGWARLNRSSLLSEVSNTELIRMVTAAIRSGHVEAVVRVEDWAPLRSGRGEAVGSSASEQPSQRAKPNREKARPASRIGSNRQLADEGGDKKSEPNAKPAAGSSFHTQEQSNSCVVATSRNIIQHYTGKDIPESQLRDELREIMGNPDHDFETTPINPLHAKELLKRHGVDTDVSKQQTLEQLETMVAKGPIMIGFPGHRVALASVQTDSSGKRTFMVMDPAPRYGGKPRSMSESEFKSKYNPKAIVIAPK